MLERFFGLSKRNTNVKTEVLAGLTTFMTMAYILTINPDILRDAGMDHGAVFTATALSSIIAILIMALYANLPFALAPGMGLNAFFAYSVVLGMGYTWQFALTAVLVEGIIFILFTFFNIREAIIDSIPLQLKHAVSVGIGFFIAFIGLAKAKLVVDNPATLVSRGPMDEHSVWIFLAGILIMGILLVKKVKGALLIGIIASTIIGIPLGVTQVPEGLKFISTPPSLAPTFFKFDFSKIFSIDMLIVLFTFLFVDLFDTVGTLVGVASKADMLDPKDGRLPRAKQALFADAVGTTIGSILGTSTVTTYVESASGVAEGGRTGLTSLTTGVMFAISLFLSPLFLMVPAAATAPALVLVGLFMMSPILKIDLNDHTIAIPAFLTIIMMPLTYSVAEGIAFGLTSFVILKTLTGKSKDTSPLLYVLAVLFIIKFVVS
ncbi:guanine permease [candidate division KSB3 bacterium]|uniref:Guanine permease n=1 Tax=candidate division KSB3 bacterium TaxID=2044937 RepID=A0A2G6EAQ8_9BACT|nr:MAG: guanine permease [candidate division KSB3 bacterium]PIE30830.1 MAG: guanine permease [candidate division KSB3 bacterium]